jgi:RNA polymerase sigma factor (sigma-70 family)
LRLRSDEQLVALFRDGHEEAFRVIHDRYRQRLFAYTRQMLPRSRQDAEDALQDIFVRAYSGLRASDRELTLRAWLYRVAHNRCVDELRRPIPPAPEVLGILRARAHDPVAEAEQRESLRRLIEDVRRLPEQQRSALLMRELGGMPYSDIAGALGVSVPAVKSLLVRARVGLAQAVEARDTACSQIREDLIIAHDRGVRASGLARRHMHDCSGCREFRGQMRGVSRQFAALVAPIGPLGVLANMLGIGGGASSGAAAAGGGASAGAGAAAAVGGAAGTGAASVGAGFVAVGHVATLLAAAVVTAGGAVELQHTLSAPAHHRHHVHHVSVAGSAAAPTAGSIGPAAPATITYPSAGTAAQSGSTSLHGSAVVSSTRAGRTSAATATEPSSSATSTTPVTGGSSIGAGTVTSGGASSSGPGSTSVSSTVPPDAPSTPVTGDGTGVAGSTAGTGVSGSGSTGAGTSAADPTSSSPATVTVTSSPTDPTATSSSADPSGSGTTPASGSTGTSSTPSSG